MKKLIKIKPLQWFKDNCEHIERGYLVPKFETKYWFNNKMKPFCGKELEVTYIESENLYKYIESNMIIMFEKWMLETIEEN